MTAAAHAEANHQVKDAFVRWARDPVHASVFQPGVSLFECSAGLLGWQKQGRATVVMGPPLAASRMHAREALSLFLAEHPRAVFTYLRTDDFRDLDTLAPGRFVPVPMGLESFVDIRKPSCEPAVLSAVRKASKAGLSVEPCPWSDLSAEDARHLRRINETWVAHSQLGRELRFLNRPMLYAADPGRLFCLRLNGRLFGFVVLDPYLDHGQPGWMLNLIRFEPVKVWGVYLAAVERLKELLADEGAQTLSLGLSPLLLPSNFDASRLPLGAQLCLRALVPLRRRLYNFQGIDRFKSWLSHERYLRYVAVPRGALLTAPGQLLRVHGLSWSLLWARRGGNNQAAVATGSSRRISSTA